MRTSRELSSNRMSLFISGYREVACLYLIKIESSGIRVVEYIFICIMIIMGFA